MIRHFSVSQNNKNGPIFIHCHDMAFSPGLQTNCKRKLSLLA